MPISKKTMILGGFAGAAALVLAGGVMLFSGHFGPGYSHATGMHGHHGLFGGGHDEVNMPGLRGADTSDRETEEMATMFRRFEDITRTVTNLPDGIRTVTHSDDEELMHVVISHAAEMINRVAEGRDPQVIIQSPTLDIFFQRGEAIETQLDVTDEGLVIIQTSDDPEMVAALQTHAAEVTAMVERGMAAVHEMMEQRAAGQ